VVWFDEPRVVKTSPSGCLDPRANGKTFAPITSDVWTLIRSIKYSLIKKLIT
jgi:hypothetical protein